MDFSFFAFRNHLHHRPQISEIASANMIVNDKPTIPLDRSRDRIADSWQIAEIARWNQQFNFAPNTPGWIDPADHTTWQPVFGTPPPSRNPLIGSDYGADAEHADSDGLTAFEEYRGFFLDGGPGITTPRHRRLSVAKKELLVECSVMDGIGSVSVSLVIPESDFEDEGNDANAFAQAFDVDERMASVADFFAKSGKSG